jgi:hypothetical protein
MQGKHGNAYKRAGSEFELTVLLLFKFFDHTSLTSKLHGPNG